MQYRADIDGLRALAVVPVLLYHAGIPGFPGGFVGVDIFFVISGYLICGMINADIRNRLFSLGEFYKRRVLRILPALFVMFLVTSVFACLYFLPVELEDYARSLASAVGSVANIYFAGTAGYFDAPAETKPLLHTWSLGVEEQFYFIVPLLMLLVWRAAPKHARLLFAVAAALSFAAAIAVSYSKPHLRVLSGAVSRLGAGARRAAGDRVLSGAANRVLEECLRRGGDAAAARRHLPRLAVGAAAADDFARQHRLHAGDRFERKRRFERRADCCRCGRWSSSA